MKTYVHPPTTWMFHMLLVRTFRYEFFNVNLLISALNYCYLFFQDLIFHDDKKIAKFKVSATLQNRLRVDRSSFSYFYEKPLKLYIFWWFSKSRK